MTTLGFLDKIPSLLIYFLPGFLFTEIRNALIPSRKKSDIELVLGSIFWSFVLIYLSKLLVAFLGLFIVWNKEIVNSDPNNPFYAVGLFISAIIIGLIWGKTVRSKWVISMLENINIHIIPTANVWSSILDLPKGGWAKIYLINQPRMYIGQIIKYSIDPNSEINEIYLDNYKLYSLDGELILEGLKNSGVYLQKGDFYSLEVFSD